MQLGLETPKGFIEGGGPRQSSAEIYMESAVQKDVAAKDGSEVASPGDADQVGFCRICMDFAALKEPRCQR